MASWRQNRWGNKILSPASPKPLDISHAHLGCLQALGEGRDRKSCSDMCSGRDSYFYIFSIPKPLSQKP